jgi:phytoene dehydrogenase-like protein
VEADEPRREVLVIGAGISGLSAAWALHRAGLDDLLVLERAPDIGGVSLGGHLQGHDCSWGAHYIGLPDPDSPLIVSLLSDLGVITDITPRGRLRIEPAFRVRRPEVNLYHGHSHSTGYYAYGLAGPTDRAELAAFEADLRAWASWRDKRGRPAFQLPVAYATDDERVRGLDRISFAHYLRKRGWRSPLLWSYVDNRLTDEYGGRATEISAYAALLFWAAEGGRDQAPQDDDGFAPVISWPEGNAWLARALAGRLPANSIRTGAWVTHLEQGPDEVRATVTDPDSGLSHVYRARHVIWAAPQLGIDRLLPGLAQAGRKAHRQLEYTPWLVANLLLEGCPEHDAKALAWDNLIHDSWSLGLINGQHFNTPGADIDNDHDRYRLTFYASFSGDFRHSARRDLLALDWDSWARLIVGEASRALPTLDSHLRQLDIWRWGHAMLCPAPGLLWGGTREELSAPLGRIHFACNDAAVLPLYEEAAWRGVAAAEEILTARGRPFGSLLAQPEGRLG